MKHIKQSNHIEKSLLDFLGFIDEDEMDENYITTTLLCSSSTATQSTGCGSKQISSMILGNEVIEENDHKGFADFIERCKNGNKSAAINFLTQMLQFIERSSILYVEDSFTNDPPFHASKEQKAAREQLSFRLHNSSIIDACQRGVLPSLSPCKPILLILDNHYCSLSLIVPDEPSIIGSVIGKSGAEISRIEKQCSVNVKIETSSELVGERCIKITGSVESVVLAQQSISRIVHERMIVGGIQAEILKIFVQQDFVPHFVGKGGQNIEHIASVSGVHIQVVPRPRRNVSKGDKIPQKRIIVIKGVEKCRSYALYLTLRVMCSMNSSLNVLIPRGLNFSVGT
jgi:transcription antitermination factor NusA-like protein